MTLLEYNCRNIIVILALICALFFVVFKIASKFNKLHCPVNILKTIIGVIALMIFAISCFCSWETNTQFQEGIVTECVRLGSVGDYIVNYTFYIVDDQGNETAYNTPIISSKKYINKLENIEKNDQVIIKYGSKLHYAYDIEKAEQNNS